MENLILSPQKNWLVPLPSMASTSTAAVGRLKLFGSHLPNPSVPMLHSPFAVVPRRCCPFLSISACASGAGEQQFASIESPTTSQSSPFVALSSSSSQPPAGGAANGFSRRFVLTGVTGSFGALSGLNGLFVTSSRAAESKQINLSIEDVKKIIEEDIVQRQYYVTGDLTQSVYDENCRFQDPTLDLSGVKQYTAAVASLFDAANSKHELLNIAVTGPHSVEVSWRLSGFLKLPWHPYISPYEGVTIYTTNEEGLIKSHSETWNISLLTAFIQLVTPSWLNKDTPK